MCIRDSAKEVYFALIDNNIVSIKHIAEQSTDTEAQVYSAFLSKQDSTMDWIRSELADGDTPYGKLNEEQQLYIWYVYTSLKDRGVFNTSNVDTTDDVYKDWTQADGTSLKELLTDVYKRQDYDCVKIMDYMLDKLKDSGIIK